VVGLNAKIYVIIASVFVSTVCWNVLKTFFFY